ncbi:hypothetical protein X880_2124 [Burkholderia pseudomallei MSHR4032]|nr:hypothetical protein Y038_2246 [Burkholderia pseudomallei MSHR543]KGV02296.1 hypothetical protein X880_2124 [Burkholderia pseudomallei MSHR4032]
MLNLWNNTKCGFQLGSVRRTKGIYNLQQFINMPPSWLLAQNRVNSDGSGWHTTFLLPRNKRNIISMRVMCWHNRSLL